MIPENSYIRHRSVTIMKVSVPVVNIARNAPPSPPKGALSPYLFPLLPHIDSDDPPMAARFRSDMKLRPSVERMIKRLKCDLSDDRLKKRGNASFQAYLDKTMIALHILLR
jgi:hypothetical protein